MDSFELNKIMGAVLGTLLFIMGIGFIADAVYHPIQGKGPGYALPEPEVAAAGESTDAAPEVPLGVLLASASAERGAAAAKKCQSCHDFSEANANKTGPGLYELVGRLEGSHEGYAYSDALLAHNAAGDTWTYENLNAFLTRPADYAPGTKMNFGGIRTAEERADILAYLQTLSASPVPFPAAEAAPAEAPAAEAAPAEAPAAEAAPAADAAPAAAPAATPAPAAATQTPETTQTETPVEGTPTTTTETAPATTTH